MYLLIKIFKKSEFMAAQRARPILLNERFLVIIIIIYIYIYIFSGRAVRRARAVNALRANVGPAGRTGVS